MSTNRFLTFAANLAFGLRLSEAHTGFRAYSRRLLLTLPFVLNSDQFVLDKVHLRSDPRFRRRLSDVVSRYHLAEMDLTSPLLAR